MRQRTLAPVAAGWRQRQQVPSKLLLLTSPFLLDLETRFVFSIYGLNFFYYNGTYLRICVITFRFLRNTRFLQRAPTPNQNLR